LALEHLLLFNHMFLFINRKHTYIYYISNNDGTDMNNFRMAIVYIQHPPSQKKVGPQNLTTMIIRLDRAFQLQLQIKCCFEVASEAFDIV